MQQYEWLKENYPPLFDEIKAKEKTGQWEIIGGVSLSVSDNDHFIHRQTYRAGWNMVSLENFV